MVSKDKKSKPNQPASRAAPAPPSAWVSRFAPLVEPGASVLDYACGGGRHGRLFLARGHKVTFADRDLGGLNDLADDPNATLIEADLEAEPWPFKRERFGAVVVTNYLWRPRFDALLGLLAPDGLLIYETFATGNEAYGRPRNPDFLLRRGELLECVRGRAHVIAYEQRTLTEPRPAVIQHIAARALE
jgi:SAM-dependent methyltransferase